MSPALKDTQHLSVSLPKRPEYLAAGQSGVVYKLDDARVLKDYFDDSNDGDIERRAYERLGSHPHIAKYLGSRPDGSIVLERGRVLREICRLPGNRQISTRRKVRWLRDAANGFRYIHEQGIIHADVGSHNAILTTNGWLKIIDFSGVSIDGEEASAQYEWFSYRPSMPVVSIQTDIFAFGCMAYEIMTGRPPHHEFEKADNKARHVEQLYRNNQFPDVANLPLGELMQGCWYATFSSMSEIVQALEIYSSSSLRTRIGAAVTRLLRSSCFNQV